MLSVQKTKQEIKAVGAKRPRSQGLYTSKIIKAGALIGDTKTLLSHWDENTSTPENTDRLQRENVFGKASRSRVEDILAIFRQRYLQEESITNALVTLVHGNCAATAIDRILYFHSARADRLIYDTVVEILVPMRQEGLLDINTQEFQRHLSGWVEEGKTSGHWSASTVARISQGLLSTLRDFGVLQGASNKKIAPLFLPVEAFAYIAFYLTQQQSAGANVIELPDWKLYFLSRDGAERCLFEAHQQGLLEYHVAGSVSRLSFPVDTLEEYAHVLSQR